jgi:hypothetical protein
MESTKVQSNSTARSFTVGTLFGAIMLLALLSSAGLVGSPAGRSRNGRTAAIESAPAAQAPQVSISVETNGSDSMSAQPKMPGHSELDLQLD